MTNVNMCKYKSLYLNRYNLRLEVYCDVFIISDLIVAALPCFDCGLWAAFKR